MLTLFMTSQFKNQGENDVITTDMTLELSAAFSKGSARERSPTKQ